MLEGWAAASDKLAAAHLYIDETTDIVW